MELCRNTAVSFCRTEEITQLLDPARSRLWRDHRFKMRDAPGPGLE
jgi:hypothetical protein